MTLAHYIFVRRDLPLGTLAAMVTHAAGDSASHRMWPLPPHTIAVVLEATDEPSLKDIRIYLQGIGLNEGVEMFTVIESGGEYDGQMMAVGLLPQERDKVSNHMKRFRLLTTCKETT